MIAFALSLVGQLVAGHRAFNEDQLTHGGETVSLARYSVSSSFGSAVMESWQSEFLQFTFFILATIWLVQRGSAESKAVEEIGLESDQQQKVGEFAESRSPRWAKIGGWRTTLYSNSLLTGYLAAPDFWEKTFQNWQSEFLAVGTMAVFTIYLRQRGSPESKPVGAHTTRPRPQGSPVGLLNTLGSTLAPVRALRESVAVMTITATGGNALVEELLTAAHGLVRDGWCQGHAAVDDCGRPVSPTSAFARAWSAPGALERLWARHEDRFGVPLEAYKRANLALSGAVGGVPQAWNDVGGRTLPEVLDALAEAVHLVAGSPVADPPPKLYALSV